MCNLNKCPDNVKANVTTLKTLKEGGTLYGAFYDDRLMYLYLEVTPKKKHMMIFFQIFAGSLELF